MGRSSDYRSERREAFPSESVALAEALLASTFQKRGQSILIQFDQLRDSNTVHRVLTGLRDGYRPPRK